MTEVDHFLENQKKVMAQREGLRAEAKTFPIGTVGDHEQAHEPVSTTPRPGEPFLQQQQKPFVPEVRPMPQRIQPQTLPSLESIKADLTDLAKEIEESKADFVKSNASLDEWFAPLKEAEALAAKLRAELAEAEQKVRELRDRGTPTSSFRKYIQSVEQQVSTFAGLIEAKLVDVDAQDKFGVSADRLHPTTRSDLRLRHADRYRRFGRFYVQTHRKEVVTADQLELIADRLVTDLQFLQESF
jgi:exonuclease VII small subunit